MNNRPSGAQIDWRTHPQPATIERILPPHWTSPIPPASNRSAWQAAWRGLQESDSRIIDTAVARSASQPIAQLLASDKLDYERSGVRDRFDLKWRSRRGDLAWLTIGECLKFDRRLTEKIQDLAWATCEEASWELPAHSGGLADPDRLEVDLGCSMTALQLAELHHLLAGSIHPLVSRQIAKSVRSKCVDLYTIHDHYWWLRNKPGMQINNWAAVCTAGVVGAAVYLIDDTVELASILSRALPTIDDYLDGFDETGALSEGVGYWNYGLGYFTMLVDLIDRRTNGAINIWSDERFRRAACFPLRCALTQTSFPSFSDCIRKVALWRPLLHVLAERLEIPELDSAAAQLPLDNGLSPESAATVVARDLFWGFPQSDSRSRLADYDWFPGVSWMIARAEPDNPAGLVLAVKAGHNGEMHNQNDVGSFLVEVGDEQLIADLGAGLYTKQYWSDSRYELFATSSRGHSVPEVDGREQKPGAESGARNVKPLLDGHSTGMSMDLSPAYPDECGLLSLDRTIRLNRDRTGGCVHLVDIAEFASSGSIASVLITRSDVALVNGMVIIQGSSRALHCVYDNSAVNVRIETVDNVALADGPTQVRRIVFQGRHGRISRIDVVITPDSSISAPTLTAHQERRAKTTCSLVAANSLPQE